MKSAVILIFIFLSGVIYSQEVKTFTIPANSILNSLTTTDSLVYYQCHVEEATQQVSTVSGQTFTSQPQKYSITEKYVVKKDSVGYSVKYFISSMIILPNRKFSALKIREKEYWNFKKEKEKVLSAGDLKVLVAIEAKGKETTEYDFVIDKYNTNQVIIKTKKNFKQLVIDGNYILSKYLFG